jgi:hypothetical protein
MTTEIEHVVNQLRRVGLRPSERQWEIIRSAGPAAVQPLLALALDVDTLAEPEPASLGPLHALRLLGELPPPEPAEIERLIRTLPPEQGDASQGAYIWWQELPQIVARWGKAGYEAAQRVLLDPEAGTEPRAVAAESLAFMVEADDALRPEATELLRDLLGREPDPYVMAHVVEAVANLGLADAYTAVMDAYKRGAVDKQTITAAAARQRLLSPKSHEILACVHHPLAERYDKHGPYSDEQRRTMAQQYTGRN